MTGSAHGKDRSSSWVLVTGGARRLGRELCLTFARRGWNVLCHFRESKGEADAVRVLVESMGVRCVPLQADLAAPGAAAQLMAQACEAAGGAPRCVVNNASSFDADDAASATEDAMHQAFQTNVVAPLMLGQQQFNQIGAARAAQTGAYSLIHVLDQKVHNLNPDYFSYTVSKLALERAVALQAQAFAPRLRVCGVSPGLIYRSGPQTADNFERAGTVNLLRAPIDPAQVAQAVVFLAENPAITGVTLPVDNGQHLIPLERDVMFMVTPPDAPAGDLR